MSISPTTIVDTFSNTQSSGWGTSDSGHAWTTSGMVLKENWGWGSIVNMANTGLGTARIALTNYGIPEQSNDRILMRVQVSSPAQWPLTDFGPMLSFKSGNTFYYLALQGNWGEIAIGVFINGYRYEMNRTSYGFGKGAEFWVRFERTSTGMRAKVWQTNQAEPWGWTLTSGLWDGSYPPGAGSPGIWKRGTRDSHDIEVKEFYYYSANASHPTTFPVDTFEREVTEGWGVSSSGHTWEGTASVDPSTYALPVGRRGSIESANGRGVLIGELGQETSAFLGQNFSSDMEVYSSFLMGSGSVNGSIRVGLRGQETVVSGRSRASGYMVQISEAATTITIYGRNAVTAGWTSIASGEVGLTITENVRYNVRFQVVGSTLKARLWQNGSEEPTTWQVTGTSTIASTGKVWVGGYEPSNSTLRSLYFYDIEGRVPTIDPAVVRNFTTTGNISSTVGETTASFTAQITDDVNANATVTVKYKPTTATAWINLPSGVTRSGNNFNFSISGLQPSTPYNVQVTFQDVDGVYGANPKQIAFTTSATSVVGKSIRTTSTSTTSIGIEASYERDADNNSSATLKYRRTGSETPLIRDYFVDEDDGEYLQNTNSILGGTWTKHPLATATAQGVVSTRRIYSNATKTSDKLLYYHTTVAPSSEYEVTAEFHAGLLQGITGVAGRMSTTAETYYGAGVNSVNRTWELFKIVSGTKTVLDEIPFEHAINTIHTVQLVVRDAYKALVLNGEEVLRTVDNSITGVGNVGYYSSDIVQGATANQFSLDTFILSYRAPATSWSSGISMTADRSNKKFTATQTGLSPDTIYEFTVTFGDSAGVYGTSPLVITAQTTGSASGLVAIGASPSATSAVIDIFYQYDSNDNAYIDFQYRSTMEYLWTTVPFDNIHTDRSVKKFSVILTALLPSLTYEVRAYINDPDGLIDGTPTYLSGLFTTQGFLIQDQRQTKHFVWKVYDKKDKYVGTIPDAPEPEFSLHQNGGVTDLSFELQRRMTDLEAEAFIDFQNRIDIWAIDPSSDGMGPNLIGDWDCDASVGSWTLGTNTTYDAAGGPDGTSALKIVDTTGVEEETLSSTIDIKSFVPMVFKCIARASGAKLRMRVRAYDINDIVIESSDEIAETVGTDWQTLRLEFTPPQGTSYLRVMISNTGRGTMYADKFSAYAKEVLVYRGRIEAFTPSVTEKGESVDIQVLGLSSLLSDDYIEFLQFVEVQPQKDVLAGRPNHGAKDPADMMKRIIDLARAANPKFTLYYTTDSIQYTGNLMQYTFRDQQIRNCMDKVRTLCPSGWHYYIEPDGLVWLRSQESVTQHVLRIGVEILNFEVEKSIRNLKNYVRVKGRQDEDGTEPDGNGSINYVAFNQKSIDTFGKRTVFIRDAQITDPETAKMVGDGRLDEFNREEQRVECYIPDNKMFRELSGSLRGYNIEAFRPGDTLVILDPVAGSRATYWDKFKWDKDTWDMSNVFMPLPEPVPIITIQNHGSYAQLELSERPPSQVGDFARLYRWMADKERE